MHTANPVRALQDGATRGTSPVPHVLQHPDFQLAVKGTYKKKVYTCISQSSQNSLATCTTPKSPAEELGLAEQPQRETEKNENQVHCGGSSVLPETLTHRSEYMCVLSCSSQ